MAKRLMPILMLTATIWLVFVINNLLLGGALSSHGIWPRHLSGLPGILFSPFLHVSLKHIVANTFPLLVLGGVLCVRNHGEFTAVTLSGVLLGGIFTWLIGRGANHIGASGLVFSYFGYLASLAYFNRNIGNFLISIICVIAYGGMIRGILPSTSAVSWEGHLAGLLAGVAVAWLRAKATKEKALNFNAQASKKLQAPSLKQLP